MAREAYRAAAEVVRVAAEVSPRRRSSRNGGDRRGQQQAGQGRRRHPGIVGENETMQVGGCSRIRSLELAICSALDSTPDTTTGYKSTGIHKIPAPMIN
ncbi:hypothetical protein BRADI_1g27410v3 [Brachypodium distachyon]|uniref:Uncharacterized protein n=1 Tax=Brachypodium distachyon TaxID=15368 RepID=I1GUD7_BRADI|nr:hypothetical protein BRADI_1g27410v3 [Brachypodium distachyon]